MTKEYKAIIADIGAYSKELHKLIPETMAGFSSMAKSALQTKAIDEETKELIALALGVAAHCDGWCVLAPAAKKSAKRWAWLFTWAADRR